MAALAEAHGVTWTSAYSGFEPLAIVSVVAVPLFAFLCCESIVESCVGLELHAVVGTVLAAE